ncbi:MAG: MBL fold metallo-hydrolase [Clostridia bacterium]|nr:MBL fold metallo-hydrolase [Clostridia bacterium]
MIIKKLQTGVLGVNTYFLINEKTKTAVIIDGGEHYEIINNYAKELGIEIKAELLTHAHFDHAGNAKLFQDNGVKIYAPDKDYEKLVLGDTLSKDFGLNFQTFTPNYKVYDGDMLQIEGFDIKVIATAGHTDGSVCYLVDNALFTGDTLFNLSIGRTDFPTGSFEDMKCSLKKLFSLSKNYIVYPGHGEESTLNFERENNPYSRFI